MMVLTWRRGQGVVEPPHSTVALQAPRSLFF
jgi:hypothetical protein